VLRRIFGSKGEETPREWKQLHNEMFHNINMDLKGQYAMYGYVMDSAGSGRGSVVYSGNTATKLRVP
jgi:hypothetical protein